MASQKTKKTITPESLLEEAIQTAGPDISDGELRLLTSGFIALKEQCEKHLNKTEQQAMSSMISYIAYTQGVAENTICEILTARYDICTVKEMPSRVYMDAIEYLIDLDVKRIVN